MTATQTNPATEILPWSLEQLQNVGHALTETASRMPDAIAVACPQKKRSPQSHFRRAVTLLTGDRQRTQFDTITFAQLEIRSNRIAAGIQKMGIQPGTRLALMVPPGIDFVAWVFGLFKSGVVVILIDPGMGRKNMIRCLSAAQPEGIVGIPLAQLARTLFRSRFPKCRHNIVLGRWPGCQPAAAFEKLPEDSFAHVPINRESPAAIIFTTGSTGPPKGVLYRHRVFLEQSRQIRDYFNIQPGSVDVSGFPLFALFNTAMGTTTVFPKMDATRPAEVDPPEIIDAINQFNADQSFGSPALWNTVSKYCLKHSIKLPSIKRVLSAGAPVPPTVLQSIRSIIAADGDAFTPYGATEALPVACNSASVVLTETAQRTADGEGTCVGRRFPDIEWKVIGISDSPIAEIGHCQLLNSDCIGELIVRGPVVTDQYVTSVEANADHKISDGETFWHRMGDIGYLDSQDRFWFCGRKSHRLQTENGPMYTIPCEGIINTHPAIYRSALVGAGQPGHQVPVLIAEPGPEQWPTTTAATNQLIAQLKELASQHWQTDQIEHFLLHRSLPVDIRHNSKIFREQLKPWAEQRLSVNPSQLDS